MLKWILRVLTLISFILINTLCASVIFAAQTKVIFISDVYEDNPFWATITKGALDAAKLTNVNLEIIRPKKGKPTDYAKEYKDALQLAITKKTDGIFFSIQNEALIQDFVTNAKKANIPLISINSGLVASKKLHLMAHIGQDDYLAGLKAGLTVRSIGVKSILCITSIDKNHLGADYRCKGFRDAFHDKSKYNRFVLSSATQEKDRQTLASYLQKHTDVDTIFTVDLDSFDAAYKLAIGKFKSQIRVFIASDANKNILNAIKDGKVMLTVSQQEYLQGFLPVLFFAQLKTSGLSPLDFVATGPLLININNVNKYIKDRRALGLLM